MPNKQNLIWTGGPLEFSGSRGKGNLEVARVRLTRSDKWCVYKPPESEEPEKLVAVGLETAEKAKERAESDLA